MKPPNKYCKCVIALATGLCFALAPSLFAGPIILGLAADYRVVGVGGSVSIQSDFEIYQSATVIYGNVAQGPYTTLTHGIDSTVYGRWDYDLTDANPAASGYTGNVTGGFHQMDMSGVSADARAAAASAALYPPTQTYASLDQFDGTGSIIGTAGVNVIRITGDSSLKISLTLQGTATSSFIFQFTSLTTAGHDVLTLSGMTMNIGAINPDNIYWNFNGLGGDLTIKGMADDQTVYGNFLAPDRNILGDHAIVNGRLIGGGSGSELSIHSGSQIIPEANVTTLLLIGLALIGLVRFVRRQPA
jgi:choice-of-anchor A domain-containing protein